MKLNSVQFKNWKKNNNLFSIKYFLVYGPNESGVDLLTEEIAQSFKIKNEILITKIHFKTIKDDLHILIDQLLSTSLFGELKIIVIEDCPPSIPKAFNDFLSKNSYDAKLILKAGELKPTSSLRKNAELAKNVLSLACYNEDSKQMAEYIRNLLLERGIKFDTQIIPILSSILPPNRMIANQEIEKLILCVGSKSIGIDDVLNTISDSHEAGLDELCTAVAINDKAKIIYLLERANNNDVSFMLILRVLQRYFVRILEVISHLESGLSLDLAVNKLMPPVFFKQRDELMKICNNKNIANKQMILTMNIDLVKLEHDCKRTGLDVYLQIINHFNLRAVK